MKRWLITGLVCMMLGTAAYATEALPESLRVAFLNEEANTETVSGLVIVKFSFENCAPCKNLDQIFAQYDMATYINARKVRFYEVNFMQERKLSPNLCTLWKINAVPQLLFFYNGKKVGQLNGFPMKRAEQTQQEYEQKLNHNK